MQLVKAESPRIMLYDAIHETPLLNGVMVNVGKPDEDGWEVVNTENDDRYHIRTICRHIADEFFNHKDELDYVLVDFQMRPIFGIELDPDFKALALRENVVEEQPPLSVLKDKLVGTLTERLIVAYESSGINSGHFKLGLVKMQEIRNKVFDEERRIEEQKSSSPRRSFSESPHLTSHFTSRVSIFSISSSIDVLSISGVSSILFQEDPLSRSRSIPGPSRRQNEGNQEDCCDPTTVAGAGLLSGLFVLVALVSSMFSDEKPKDQRVSRVDASVLRNQMKRGGKIY